MQAQVALYAIAAKKELQYQPDEGLVRHLDVDPDDDASKTELRVPLDSDSWTKVNQMVAQTAKRIRKREFTSGPAPRPDGEPRCATCDFLGICGMTEAVTFKKKNPRTGEQRG